MFGENKVYKIKDFKTNDKLVIKSIFYTIQGEGIYAGIPATFIRTGHCSLSCDFCDTDFSNDLMEMTVDEILAKVEEITPSTTNLIVLTGGEPLLQTKIGELINKLIAADFVVQLETSGSVCVDTIPFNDESLTIVCSPKTSKVAAKLEPYIDHYKYIISHDNIDPIDGLPLKVARPKNDLAEIWVSPMDNYDIDINKLNLKTVAKVAMEFGYRVSLQMHKYLDVE